MIEDKYKREIKQQQIQKYKDKLRQKKRQQEFKTLQQHKLLKQKEEQDSLENDRNKRRILRLRQKEQRRQELKQIQIHQMTGIQQVNSRSYSMSNVREVQL